MSKIDINEIEKVYASCGADNNRVLNTNLNRGRLNSGIKCGFFHVSGRNSELKEQIAKLQNDKKNLMNRCRVLSNGALCPFCRFKEECECEKEDCQEHKKKVRNRENIFK